MLTQMSAAELNEMDRTDQRRPIRLLSLNRLRAELGEILGKAPSERTLRRWVDGGMPHRMHPITGQRYYLLLEIVEWLSGISVRRDQSMHRPGTKIRQR